MDTNATKSREALLESGIMGGKKIDSLSRDEQLVVYGVILGLKANASLEQQQDAS